jgi:hypothetical protein
LLTPLSGLESLVKARQDRFLLIVELLAPEGVFHGEQDAFFTLHEVNAHEASIFEDGGSRALTPGLNKAEGPIAREGVGEPDPFFHACGILLLIRLLTGKKSLCKLKLC